MAESYSWEWEESQECIANIDWIRNLGQHLIDSHSSSAGGDKGTKLAMSERSLGSFSIHVAALKVHIN